MAPAHTVETKETGEGHLIHFFASIKAYSSFFVTSLSPFDLESISLTRPESENNHLSSGGSGFMSSTHSAVEAQFT